VYATTLSSTKTLLSHLLISHTTNFPGISLQKGMIVVAHSGFELLLNTAGL